MKVDIYYSARNYSSISVLNNILKIFALNCIFIKENKITSKWSLLTNVIVILISIVLNILSLYYKIKIYELQNPISFTFVLQFTFLIGFVQYLSDLYHVKKFGTQVSVQYYRLYGNIDELINMNYYGIIRKKIIYTLILFTILYCLSTIFDNIAWALTVGSMRTIVYLTEYIYFIPKALTVLDTASHVLMIEYRLRTIGDMAQYENTIENKVFTINGNSSKDIRARTTCVINLNRYYNKGHPYQKVPDNILSLSRCYMLLTKQVNFINSMFGFRVSANVRAKLNYIYKKQTYNFRDLNLL